MTSRLTQTQLAQIVAEIDQLSRQRDAELDLEQIKGILRELNLPDELLDDAIVQLHRREVLKRQQQRNRWIAIVATGVTIVVLAAGTLLWRDRQQQVARIIAGQDRIALSASGGDNLTQVDRQANPRVYYQVTLNNAPLDRQLSLQCDWLDPGGQTVHQGRYQTRQIVTPVWNTHCFYDLGSAAPPGNWKVQLSLDGRVLSSKSFTVR